MVRNVEDSGDDLFVENDVYESYGPGDGENNDGANGRDFEYGGCGSRSSPW